MTQLSLYEWVYLITNVYWTYTIFKFMNIFFDTRKTSRRVEAAAYLLFFAVISAIYLFVNIPIVLMVSNLAAFILMSYIYESTMKKRLLSAVFIYLILMGVEMIVALISGYFNFPIFATNNYSSIYGLVICRVLTYVVVLILNNFKNIKKGESVPNSNWFCIVLIPVASLYIILLLFQAREISAQQVIAGVMLLLLINFLTFYLYDVITAALSQRMENMLILEQNKYYERQFEFMKTSLQTTSMIKHDLKNHMFSIRSLIESGDKNGSLDYVANIMTNIRTKQNYSTSGNTVIDSIINFKFQEAEQKGIKTTLDITMPENLEIPSFDMTIVLGNLLDNAIRAAHEVEENPFINSKIKYDKGRLLIQIDNSFVGQIRKENGKFLTTKDDPINHGKGLENIGKVLQKYDGSMSIDYSENVFSVTLLMYVD